MAVFDLESNALFGENGTGKLFIATDYDGAVFDRGTGTNESAIVAALEAYTFADVGYFEAFSPFINQGEERIIATDYCGVGEISNKKENVYGFSVTVQEILEMENLALILGEELGVSGAVETIAMKRAMVSKPYHLFKFVTCPKDGVYNAFYFVKSRLSNDVAIPVNNLSREDFAGTEMEFEVSKAGNFVIQKGIAAPIES